MFTGIARMQLLRAHVHRIITTIEDKNWFNVNKQHIQFTATCMHSLNLVRFLNTEINHLNVSHLHRKKYKSPNL